MSLCVQVKFHTGEILLMVAANVFFICTTFIPFLGRVPQDPSRNPFFTPLLWCWHPALSCDRDGSQAGPTRCSFPDMGVWGGATQRLAEIRVLLRGGPCRESEEIRLQRSSVLAWHPVLSQARLFSFSFRISCESYSCRGFLSSLKWPHLLVL